MGVSHLGSSALADCFFFLFFLALTIFLDAAVMFGSDARREGGRLCCHPRHELTYVGDWVDYWVSRRVPEGSMDFVMSDSINDNRRPASASKKARSVGS